VIEIAGAQHLREPLGNFEHACLVHERGSCKLTIQLTDPGAGHRSLAEGNYRHTEV
jgi:hypothetical protein